MQKFKFPIVGVILVIIMLEGKLATISFVQSIHFCVLIRLLNLKYLYLMKARFREL